MEIIEHIKARFGIILLVTFAILQAASAHTTDDIQHDHHQERQLAIGDFADLNRILDGAVLRIPNTSLRSDGVTLYLSNVRCLDVSVGDVNLWTRQTSWQTVEMNLQVVDLGMICRARYSFSWLFVSGSGEAEILSVGNDATIQGLVKSANYMSIPPEDVIIRTCDPTIWINRVRFSGSIVSWILNVVERLFRDFIASQAEVQVCNKLSGVLKDTENALAFAKNTLDQYKPWEGDSPWDPLGLENNLSLLGLPQDLKVLNFQDPEISYAAMLQSYVNQAVDFLSSPAVDPVTGRIDMQANILIRSNLLENGALTIESSDFTADSNVYEGHNDVLKTTVRFDSVKLVGLDTLSQFNPLDTIGKYTHQNKLSWDFLAFEVKATIRMSPSTLSSSIIESPSNTVVTEQVEIFFGIDDLVAELSTISLFDQDAVESLKLASFLKKDNALPCLLSTIHHADFTSLSAEVKDILAPTVTGFVSTGLDRLISNGIDAASLMYERIVLNAAPRYFQEVIRPLFADTLLKNPLGKDNACPSFEWKGDESELVDFRDLLYLPLDAMLSGATGQEPYGDLFSRLVMPYLRESVFDADLFNAGYVRPFTKTQSGTEGQLSFTGDILRHVDGKTELFDSMTLAISDLKLHNLDTVVGSMNLLMPENPNVLANKLSLGGGARHLRASTQFSLDIKGENGPLNMQNVLELSISLPSSSVSFDVLARLRAEAMLEFPMIDIANYHCWLAAIDNSVFGSLALMSVSLDVASITFDSVCVSCSSPGLEYIPEVLQQLEAAGFNSMYKEKIISILVGLMTDYAKSVNFDEMMDVAPLHCPHNARYDGSKDVPPVEFPDIPPLRNDSAETVLAIGVIALQSATIVAAKNELLLEAEVPVEEDLAVDIPPNSRILNLTTLGEDLGDWANVAFDDLRLYLSSTSKDSAKRSGLELEVNKMLREKILDEEGALVISIDNLQFEAMDFSISFVEAKLYGLDSIMAIDPLVVQGPQSMDNSMQFESLLFVCEVAIESADGNIEHVKLSYRLHDVTARINVNIALDLERLENIELGSIFDLGRVAYCAASGVHDMKFSKLQLEIGALDDPIVSGYFSDENASNIRAIIESMMSVYKEDIVNAVPLLFDNSLRKGLNAKLPSLLQSFGDGCKPQTSVADDKFIDFRDLLLSPTMALALGGTGSSPYGNLFSTLYGMLQEKILQSGATNRPLINDFFRGLTERYSNTTGSMFFGGTALEHSGRIMIAGLDATFGVEVSDVTIDNIDSVGDPLDIFRPISGEANMVNNTVSFGVDDRPLGIAGDFYCSFVDGAGVDVRNKLNLVVSFEDVVMMASVLLKIVEHNFASFPLRDLTNPHCWLATVFSKSPSRSNRLRGLELVDNAFSIGNFSLDINCTDCTSPKFDELVLSLYDLRNATEAVDSIEDTTDNLLDADFLQVALDYLVDDAVTKCPHRPEYDPNAGNEEFLLTAEDSLGIFDGSEGVKKSMVFNIANSVIAGGIFVCGLLYRWFVERRNQKWLRSLSREGRYHLQMQRQKEKEMDDMLDETTTSLFRSECISARVRYGVPAILALNMALFMVAHLGVISVIDIDATLAGQPVTVENFLSFTFIESTQKTFENGGAEMVIMLWAFTGVWPYIKVFLSLAMWMVPPSRLSVSRRGRILLWIDALANLSIVDIFTMIVGVALLLVFIGGPDEYNTGEDSLYSLKAIVVPRAGCYCIVIAQRISRASSRFLLEYHEQAIQEATRVHEAELQKVETAPLHAPAPPSDSDEEESSAILRGRNRDREVPSTPSTDESEDKEEESSSKKEKKWGLIGAYFAGLTIVIVFVIGATFAPSISIDATSIGGLTIESDRSLDEVVGSYGVFLVVSGLLIKARFVFDERIDYIGFGLLLFAGVVSVGMVLVMKVYLFIQRRVKERKEPPKKGPSYGHQGCGIPYYIRLTKWRHMEIYMIAVAIGIWQLGSVISYAIYFYCDLMTKTFEFMSFVGIVENAPAECYNTQAQLPENLLIILGAFCALMIIFVLQARKQYKKNISDSLRWIDDSDVPHLSLAWSQDMSKNSKYAHLSSSLTASMSWDTATDSDAARSSGRRTPPGTPATEAWTPTMEEEEEEESYQPPLPAGTNGLHRNTSMGSSALQLPAVEDDPRASSSGQKSSTPERIASAARRLRFH